MTKREILAYLAGLVDGEGYIGIKKSKPHNGRINPGYQERIQIRMVDEPAIKLFADTFGGNYYREGVAGPHRRPLFCYQASDLIALNALKALLPFLRVKKPNAQNVCLLRVLKDNPRFDSRPTEIMGRWGKRIKVGRNRFSAEMVADLESLYQACKALNHAPV